MAIRKFGTYPMSQLDTTLKTLREYGIDPPEEMESDRDAMNRHLSAVSAFAERMKFGSATIHHTEQVIDWLIEQGWTPPGDTFLFEEAKTDG